MKALSALFFSLLLIQCSKKSSDSPTDIAFLKENPKMLEATPYEMNSKPILIEGARIMTATGVVIDSGSLLMSEGRIQKISEKKIQAPEGTEVINGKGLTLTPGLIDVHSHMGVFPAPNVDAHEDGNESSNPVTGDVWAEHGFWPQDPNLWRALAGGVTTIQVLPGSANLVGGRSFIAKLIPKISAREMRFPDAPQGLKMACGENPKRVYGDKGIVTRMGNVSGYRKAFQEALEYAREWEKYNKKQEGLPPKRNFVSETLVKVLNGEIFVNFHCYRADDISAILDVAKEFGFKIRSIHHGLEAYKVAPRLAEEDVAVATWADWWGFKAEAFDGIPYNAALLQNAGAKPIIHSDSEIDVRFLNVEAGKSLASSKKLGLELKDDQALQWVTKNAAWALRLDDKIGTLEEGKMADVVVWDGHPFSIYTKTKYVFINGEKAFDRPNKNRFRSDFELGHQDNAFNDGRKFAQTPVIDQIQWPDKSPSFSAKPQNEFLIDGANAFIKGSWVEKSRVHVKNGEIIDINPKTVAKDVAVVDGQGLWLTPGLIESNTNIGLFEVELDKRAQDLKITSLHPTPDFKSSDSLNTRNIRLANARTEGVLTAISRLFGSYASSMAVAFDLIDEGVIKSQVALFGNLTKTEDMVKENKMETSRSVVWSQLRQLLDDASLYGKDPKKAEEGRFRKTSFSQRHLKAMQPVLNGQVPWVLQAHRASDIRNIISLKSSYPKIKPVILGGSEAWIVAKELSAKSIPVMVAPSLQYPATFDQTEARFDLAAFLENEGVPLIIYDGSGAGTTRVRQEAGFAVKYGLSKEAAMKAITDTPAEVFGLKRGQIERGAKANLVLWSGDPLEPTSWVEKIWISGKGQPLMNRHRALADKYLKAQKK